MSTVELSSVVISVVAVGFVGRYLLRRFSRTVLLRQIAPGLLFSSKLCCCLRTCRAVDPVRINQLFVCSFTLRISRQYKPGYCEVRSIVNTKLSD